MKKIAYELGITVEDNFHDEERIYTLGKDNYIPISLILSLLSSYKQSGYRIFNMFASSYAISQANLDFSTIVSQEHLEDLKEQFNEGYVHESFFDLNENTSLEPDYTEMQIYDYIDVWNVFLNMATPKYNTGSEYSVLECSRDYIRFHKRKEFVEPHNAVESTLRHILEEVSNIMKKRGFVVSSDGYHIYLNGYVPLQVKEYYGF